MLRLLVFVGLVGASWQLTPPPPPTRTCNGDPHAVSKSCTWACPATCANPDTTKCNKPCVPGCECEPGYILSKVNGKCILPTKCPKGNPCGKNGTFVGCGFRCPTQYCPVDDSGIQYACKPGRPCPPGCACNDGYLRLNNKDDRCVLASDCTPVTCTRPNEEWSPCPDDCLAESCENVNDPAPICKKPRYCDPRCVCAKGFFRGSKQICIPAKECPTYKPCDNRCTPTCANPNPPDCEFWSVNTCCAKGYILSEKGGKCIKIENCPKNVPCNGDPNAVVKRCPLPVPCASTCKRPNALFCKVGCKDVGCECKPGYLFNVKGNCIKPEQCPGGSPCKKTENFSPCRHYCPNRFCPSNAQPTNTLCPPPNPCYPGCICRNNYLWRNKNNLRCIPRKSCSRSFNKPPTYDRQDMWLHAMNESYNDHDDNVGDTGEDDGHDDGDSEDDVDDDHDDHDDDDHADDNE